MDGYISRQAAIEALDKEYRYGADIDRCGLATALDEIESIPAADVVPVVHGKWEDKEVIHKRCIEEWQSARCSACGKYHTTPYMYYFDDFKFCPNCGAKMDGERKE